MSRQIRLMKTPKGVLEGTNRAAPIGRPPVYPWNEMQPGQCFEIPVAQQSQVLGNGKRYADRNNTGARYTSRKTGNGKALIIRVE